MQQVNQQLRTLFGNLTFPNDADYLYDMTGHIVLEPFFDFQCQDTTSVNNWYALYEEMYYSAYDTVGMKSPCWSVSSAYRLWDRCFS